LIPSTLMFNCQEDYGFSKISNTLVIPYEKGTPIEGSRFGHPHEAANYTIQTALFQGIPDQALVAALIFLKEDIIKDMLLGIHPEKTAGYKLFKELWKGEEEINLLAITPLQFTQIKKGIEESKEITLHFTKNYLLPSIQFDTKKLSSPVGMLYFLFGEQIKGFSGTLGNSDLYPIGVKCYPEPVIDAKTICLLVEHSMEGNQGVMIIKEENEQAVCESLKMLKRDEPFFALIDGGGFLNQEAPGSLAEKWGKELLHENSPLAILCHDNNGELFLQTSSGKKNPSIAKVDLDKRFTIYRQPYTTGSDVLQPSNGVGVVTINRNVQLSDIIQNVRRMRQLDGNQRIRFMLTEDVCNLIATTLNIKPKKVDTTAILKFSLINQIKTLQEDAVKSSLQQILTAYQSEILNVILSTPHLNQLSGMLDPVLETIFAPKQSTNSWDMYGHVSEEKETAIILKDESDKVKCLLMDAMKDKNPIQNFINFKSIEEQIEKINNNMLLPYKSIINSTTQMNQQVKVQAKQQTHVQEASQVMNSIECPVVWKHFCWKDQAYKDRTGELSFVQLTFPNPYLLIPETPPFSVYPFQQYIGHNLFSEKLMISINFALPSTFFFNNTQPFGQQQGLIQHVMIIQHHLGASIVIISPNDVEIAKNLEVFPVNCCLYNLVLGPLRTGSNYSANKIIEDESDHLALLQARLLAGFWQFEDHEKELLKSWIRWYGVDTMGTYFKNAIFKHYVESQLLCARIAKLFLDDEAVIKKETTT
ncbi:MAG TPA: hypothetical protein VGP47_01010, partial [Parachlamydiaceae bacterium]|nr:hypothetical protein [Nitrosopumilus sp.]HEV8051044.1 hypothetical protein [Parachlamydiaceae bacterium]